MPLQRKRPTSPNMLVIFHLDLFPALDPRGLGLEAMTEDSVATEPVIKVDPLHLLLEVELPHPPVGNLLHDGPNHEALQPGYLLVSEPGEAPRDP